MKSGVLDLRRCSGFRFGLGGFRSREDAVHIVGDVIVDDAEIDLVENVVRFGFLFGFDDGVSGRGFRRLCSVFRGTFFGLCGRLHAESREVILERLAVRVLGGRRFFGLRRVGDVAGIRNGTAQQDRSGFFFGSAFVVGGCVLGNGRVVGFVAGFAAFQLRKFLHSARDA